MKYQQALLP